MPTISRSLPSITVDRYGAALAILLVLVTVTSVAMVPYFQAPDGAGDSRVEQSESLESRSAEEKAAAGGGWAIAEALFAASLLVVGLLWRRLPGWLQQLVKDNAAYGIMLFVGGRFAIAAMPWWKGALSVLGLYTAAELLDEFGLWWVLNNIIALGVAVFMGAIGGIFLGIEFVLIGLIGLTIYDHAFANKQNWMFVIGGVLLRVRFPVLLLVPQQWQMDWDAMIDQMESAADESNGPIAFGLGTADLMLPAMFAAAVAAYPAGLTVFGWPVTLVGVLAGLAVAAFRLRWELEHEGSGAGLPALTSGVVGGWVLVLPFALLL